MSTTSQPTRAAADRAAVVPAPRWARIVVWSLILAGCAAFWAGVAVVMAAL